MFLLRVVCEKEIDFITPTFPSMCYFLHRSDVEPDEFKLDKALRWLNGSEGVIADFVALRFRGLNKAGHMAGPESLEVRHNRSFGIV